MCLTGLGGFNLQAPTQPHSGKSTNALLAQDRTTVDGQIVARFDLPFSLVKR